MIGTFTVEGKTTTWKQIYMSRHQDQERPSQHFLILLVADRPVAEADREPARLQELAQAGQVRAIRMVWHEGFDGITTTPFHKDASDSGTVTRGGAIIDLTRYDERELEAQFKSKMLGQNWHFNAFFKGRVTQGPPMDAVEFDAPAPTTKAVTGNGPHQPEATGGIDGLRVDRRGLHAGGQGREGRGGRALPAGWHVAQHEGQPGPGRAPVCVHVLRYGTRPAMARSSRRC